MRGQSLLLTAALALCTATSCTYNYFDGTVNYKVYVPELEQQTVNDCQVLIYNAVTGDPVATSFAQGAGGDSEQADLSKGIFNFRLDEGEYKVCVLTDTEQLDVSCGTCLSDGNFRLKDTGVADEYGHPGNVQFDYILRAHDGVTEITDTAHLKVYPARIDVRYCATLEDPGSVKKVSISINNIAHEQLFATDTIPSPCGDTHSLYVFENPEQYPAIGEGALFFMPMYLFPTAPDTPLTLGITLSDASGAGVISHFYNMYRNGEPVVLHCGDRAVVEIGNNGITISIEGWNDVIQGGGSDIGGSKPGW